MPHTGAGPGLISRTWSSLGQVLAQISTKNMPMSICTYDFKTNETSTL